jgi:hypothetical protein
MLEWWKTRNDVRTADYTLRLKRRFREWVHVIDQEAGRDFHFSGELVGKSWSQINISLPKALPDQDIQPSTRQCAREAWLRIRHRPSAWHRGSSCIRTRGRIGKDARNGLRTRSWHGRRSAGDHKNARLEQTRAPAGKGASATNDAADKGSRQTHLRRNSRQKRFCCGRLRLSSSRT